MTFSEFEHVIRAAADITKEKHFIIIGSQAILASKQDTPRDLRHSMELDMYPRDAPQKAEELNCIGREWKPRGMI